ncbi:acyltransferase family protein [Yersinia rohdei]|uniref:Acyltransferase family protein n=1 Tax=Yersinia rohdei TaxID=29485 RepID=A0ABM5S8U4_YERRO|nr:acyltransferase family protein [Yersinia rohdei]AJJ09703.1 acyltransferase family protein [Yersinia rohdei]EEQ01863.1 Acyltransferase 3 [Yersinia rohdei ATCC 43380]
MSSDITKYRAELDGLRAVAVISVLLYHVKFSLFGYEVFKGGFLGVDIFFVLSGYLITTIIFTQMNAGVFSLKDFFIRRIKRILPAMVAVLLVSSVFAFYFLLPDSLIIYVKTLLASLFFVSNLYFFGEDTYVSDSSEYKPLLHTWSLSVEWQFYLIFPFLCLWLFKRFKNKKLTIIFSLFLLSLVLSNILAYRQPNFAFYMLPSRMWELMAGSIVAIIILENKLNVGKIYYKVFPVVGLVLITLSILFINDGMLHPSVITLIPVLGTCLIILFSRDKNLASNFLSLKPMIFIGAISYSIYLWHQPLFVFYRIKIGEIGMSTSILLILLSIVISVLSFYLIEKPFRTKQLSRWKLIVITASPIILIMFSAFILVKNSSSDQTETFMSPLAKKMYEDFKVPEFRRLKGNSEGKNYLSGEKTIDCTNRSPLEACKFGDESWVVLGDSYAASFEYALQNELAEKGHGIISLTYEQCSFVSEKLWFGTAPECPEINRQRWQVINNFTDKKTFLIAANYAQFKDVKVVQEGEKKSNGMPVVGEELVWESLAENINKLLSLGHRVVVIYPIPSISTDVKIEYFRLLNMTNSHINKVYDKRTKGYYAALSLGETLDNSLTSNPNLIIIKPVDSLCSDNRCLIINKDGGLYNNGNHLSNAGARLVLGDVFQKATAIRIQ